MLPTPHAVCASAQPLGASYGCSGYQTYAVAEALCASASARLCSADELIQNVAYDSGCNLDKKPVWTSDACGTGSRMVRPQAAHTYWSSNPNSRDECELETNSAAHVVCCGPL